MHSWSSNVVPSCAVRAAVYWQLRRATKAAFALKGELADKHGEARVQTRCASTNLINVTSHFSSAKHKGPAILIIRYNASVAGNIRAAAFSAPPYLTAWPYIMKEG